MRPAVLYIHTSRWAGDCASIRGLAVADFADYNDRVDDSIFDDEQRAAIVLPIGAAD